MEIPLIQFFSAGQVAAGLPDVDVADDRHSTRPLPERGLRRYPALRRLSSRGGSPSRKVRTSQGRVVGNADPGKPAGKCHRKDTA